MQPLNVLAHLAEDLRPGELHRLAEAGRQDRANDLRLRAKLDEGRRLFDLGRTPSLGARGLVRSEWRTKTFAVNGWQTVVPLESERPKSIANEADRLFYGARQMTGKRRKANASKSANAKKETNRPRLIGDLSSADAAAVLAKELRLSAGIVVIGQMD